MSAAVLFAIAACDAEPPAATAPELVDIDCPVHEIAGNVFCREIVVAENPEMPDGRTIPIRIMVLAATGDLPQADPLVIIPGGPGQSAIEASNLRRFFSDYFTPIRVYRDIVLVDQRGVGGSNPLPLSPEAESLYVRTGMNLPPEWGRDALPGLERVADLTQYTTARAVEDLDAVRRAIGASRINLYATSYGTRVAQYYLKRHGEHVRAAILKGVSPPTDNIALIYGRNPQRSLDLLLTMCATDTDCAEAYPDLRGRLEEVLAQLAREPVRVDIEHPVSGESHAFEITRGNFAFGIRSQMMNAFAFASLPKLIVEAHRGDFSSWAPFLAQIPAVYATVLYGGMTFSVIATEDVPRLTESAIRADSDDTLIGDTLARGFMELEGLWPQGSAPADLFTPLESDVPVLLVSGALDPATPPAGAEAMLPGLSSARHIVFRGGAHSAANFEGLDRIMAEFIDEGSADDLDLSAVDANRPPAFDVGSGN